MRLKDSREAYNKFTGKASDVARQSAFAGLAVIWLFKEDYGIPGEFILPASLIVIGIALDFLQYVYGAAAWGLYHRYKAKKLNFDNEAEFTVPMIINIPTGVFFWTKVITISLAYIALGISVGNRFL